MTEVEKAEGALENGEFDLDEELFIDTVTVYKLAFLIPLVDKIFNTSEFDVKIKRTALSFLRRSITDSFIKVFIYIRKKLCFLAGRSDY